MAAMRSAAAAGRRGRGRCRRRCGRRRRGHAGGAIGGRAGRRPGLGAALGRGPPRRATPGPTRRRTATRSGAAPPSCGCCWGSLVVAAGSVLLRHPSSTSPRAQQVEVPSVVQPDESTRPRPSSRRRASRSTARTSPTPTCCRHRVRPEPNGQAKADKGSTVALRVSAGLGEAEVPSVVGFTKAAATSLLQNTGFAVQGVAAERPDRRGRQRDLPEPGRGHEGRQGLEGHHQRVERAGRRCRPRRVGQSAGTASATLTPPGSRCPRSQQASTSVARRQGHQHQPAGRHPAVRRARRSPSSCRPARRPRPSTTTLDDDLDKPPSTPPRRPRPRPRTGRDRRRSRPLRPVVRARKLAMRSWPPMVRIDSGWNCTPSTSSSRWRSPMTMPSSVSAVISSTSGTDARSTTSEW